MCGTVRDTFRRYKYERQAEFSNINQLHAKQRRPRRRSSDKTNIISFSLDLTRIEIMKTIAIFMGLFLALVVAEEEKECPFANALKKHLESCINELKPSEESLKLIAEQKGEDKEEVQCFWACLMRKSDMMKDAKLQFDIMEETMKQDEKADPKEVDEIMEMIKSCQNEAEVSDNECEVAGKYGMCMKAKKEAKK